MCIYGGVCVYGVVGVYVCVWVCVCGCVGVCVCGGGGNGPLSWGNQPVHIIPVHIISHFNLITFT